MNIKNVLVTVTNTGYIHKQTVLTLLKIQHEKRYKVTIDLPVNNPYENNLNHIVQKVLRGNYDYWLQIDSDNAPINNPLDLISYDKDIMILPYPQWHCTRDDVENGNFPIVWLAMDDVENGFKEHKEQKGLTQIDAGGSGCMIIARRVLENIDFPFSRTWDKNGLVNVGVDFNFCRKATAIGFQIWTHYDYPTMHFKEVELMEVQHVFDNFYKKKFSKQQSSGRDLVIYCGDTREFWDGETHLERGIAGSEEAIIYLAPQLVKLGWNVTVYNKCKNEKTINGVFWKPFNEWNRFDRQDVTIVWRKVPICNQHINTQKLFLDLHDVGSQKNFTTEVLKNVDKIFVKSNFHRNLYPNVPDDKFAVISNGINLKEFKNIEKDKFLIINTSAPDRGLEEVIKIFKEVKKQIPQAKLKWAYGWNLFDELYADNKQMMEWKGLMLETMGRDDNIENLNRITHKNIADLYCKAQIFLYPTTFPEVNCISALKAQAGGAIPIVSNYAALKESVQQGYKIPINQKINKEEFIDRIIKTLQSPFQINRNLQKYNWQEIAKQWNEQLLKT